MGGTFQVLTILEIELDHKIILPTPPWLSY